MAHELQDRYSKLVDAKLRATLVKKDGVIFNNRYEGNPKAGKVKVPVRDTEVAVADYSKTDGAGATHGDTSYIDVTVDKDKAVNEIIDGFDAAAVPDNLVADRLDSAAYSMALQIEKDATTVLEAQATTFGDTSALSPETIYGTIVDVRTAMSKAHIPNDNRRWLLVSPETYALILKSPEFVRATQLGDAVVQTGAQGRIAGFNVFEDTTLSETTDFIAGHPDWCTRVNEWGVNVHLQDLSGSGKYIRAAKSTPTPSPKRKSFRSRNTRKETSMLYCDYDTYSAMGGTMSAEQYGLWGPRASRKIDELTLGRAEGHAADLETELADACAQMADAMQRLAAAKIAAPGLSSVNVDGYIESYMNPTELARTAGHTLYSILSDALGPDRYGLLYRGMC